MRVFVTGATGFIGSRVVTELIGAGHSVLGLTRSDAGAEALAAAGAEAHRGSLEDLESLRSGATGSDGVIHLAFDHSAFKVGLSKFAEVCEQDKRAIETLGSVLAGSNRPLVVTSGTGMGTPAPGQLAIEGHLDTAHANPRTGSEVVCASLVERGVNISVVRLPQVHDTVKQGLITRLILIARENGASAYIGEGRSRWPAAHVVDVAHLYRLAVEKAQPGSRYHAVDEEGITMRQIAEVIGKGLGLPVVSIAPEQAPAHFGWMAMFAAWDMPASSTKTREALGWNPTGPGLIADLEAMNYSLQPVAVA